MSISGMFQLPPPTDEQQKPPDANHLMQALASHGYPPMHLGQSMQHHTSNVGYQHAQEPIHTQSAGTMSSHADSGLLPALTSPLIMPQYNDTFGFSGQSQYQPSQMSLPMPQRQSSYSAQQLQLQAELLGRRPSIPEYGQVNQGFDNGMLQRPSSFIGLTTDDSIAAPSFLNQQQPVAAADAVEHWFANDDLQLPTRSAPTPLPFDALTTLEPQPSVPSQPPPPVLEPTGSPTVSAANININDFLHGTGSVTLTSLLQNTATINANSDALRVHSEPTLNSNPLIPSVYNDGSTGVSSQNSQGSTPSLLQTTSRNSSEPSSLLSSAQSLVAAHHRSVSNDSTPPSEESVTKSKTSGKAARRPTSPTTVAVVRKAQYQRHQQLDKERRHRIKAAVDELKKITNSEEQTHAEIIYNACKYVQQQDVTINQAQGVLQQLIQLVQQQQTQISQLQTDDNSSTSSGRSSRSSKRRLIASSPSNSVDRQFLSLTDESTRVLYSWIPRPSVARDLEARFRFAKIAAATEYVADVLMDYSRQSGLHPSQISMMSTHGKLGEISQQGIIVFRVLPNRHILDVNLAGSRVTGYSVEDIHNTHINAAPTCSHNEPLDADDVTHLDDSRYTDGELSLVADELGDKPKTLTQWLLRMTKPRPIVVRSWNRCANGDVLESMPGIVMVRDAHDQPLFLLSVTLPEWARVIPKPKQYYTQHIDSPFSSSQYAT